MEPRAQNGAVPSMSRFRNVLRTGHFFMLAVGSIVGVGWLLLASKWLDRAGLLGVPLAFVVCALLVLPAALVYARVVREVAPLGAELAYVEPLQSDALTFYSAWCMYLGYLVVCIWEAQAIGSLVRQALPSIADPTWVIYHLPASPTLFGDDPSDLTVYGMPALLGVMATLAVVLLNRRGVRTSARVHYGLTLTLLVLAPLTLLIALGANLIRGGGHPAGQLFRKEWLAMFATTPYFLAGFELAPRLLQESDPTTTRDDVARTIVRALLVAVLFYSVTSGIIGILLAGDGQGAPFILDRIASVVGGPLGRACALALLVVGLGSLIKVFNGNFLGASRMTYWLGQRRYLGEGMTRLSPAAGVPGPAITVVFLIALLGAFSATAILEPLTALGSWAVTTGWLITAIAYHRHWEPRSKHPAGAVPLGPLAIGGCLTVLVLMVAGSAASIYHDKVVGYPAVVATGFVLWVGLGELVRRSAARRRAKPTVPSSTWELSGRERRLIGAAPIVRFVARRHEAIHEWTTGIEVTVYIALLLTATALVVTKSSLRFFTEHLTAAVHNGLIFLPITAVVAILGARVVRTYAVKLLDPIPADAEPNLPEPADLAHLEWLEQQDALVDCPPEGQNRTWFIRKAAELGDHAFSYLSAISRTEREKLFERWLSRNSTAITLIRVPKELWPPEAGEPRPFIGYTCVLGLSRDVAAKLRNGEMSHFDDRFENTRSGEDDRYRYIQAIYMREQARRELKSGPKGHIKIATLLVLRHLARVGCGKACCPYLLAVGLSPGGRKLLGQMGFEFAMTGKDGAPVYELDVSSEAHWPLLNDAGLKACQRITECLRTLSLTEGPSPTTTGERNASKVERSP